MASEDTEYVAFLASFDGSSMEMPLDVDILSSDFVPAGTDFMELPSFCLDIKEEKTCTEASLDSSYSQTGGVEPATCSASGCHESQTPRASSPNGSVNTTTSSGMSLRKSRCIEINSCIEPIRSKTCAPKRKIVDVDLDAIDDPEERRRQKRLAKNRRTAAVSRDRKRAQMDSLQDKLDVLQEENQNLHSTLSEKELEIERLRGLLSSSIRDAASCSPGSVAESAPTHATFLEEPTLLPTNLIDFIW